MSRVYGEPVEVWVRDDRPVRFVWRGSLYTVSRVLEYWRTTRENKYCGAERHPWGGGGATGGGQEAGEPGEAPGEREFWRVEAGAGPGSGPGVYELRRDLGKGTWLLSRAWD